MFKNIDFYIKTRCTQGVRVFFPEHECSNFRALSTVNLQEILYNSQASVGDRQYTIILFISIIFFAHNTYLS